METYFGDTGEPSFVLFSDLNKFSVKSTPFTWNTTIKI